MVLPRRPRDADVLDRLDALRPVALASEVWRVTVEGRDPLQPSRAPGRWGAGDFEVLYTSRRRDGAQAEIYAFLAAQPVFPSKPRWRAHRLGLEADRLLDVADPTLLEELGVDMAAYGRRDYGACQRVADAAAFLGYQGLVAPSARFRCDNVVLFTSAEPPPAITLIETADEPIDWPAWLRGAGAVDRR